MFRHIRTHFCLEMYISQIKGATLDSVCGSAYVSSNQWSKNSSSWWRHQMEHFLRHRSFVRGIHRSLVNSPHNGQWRGPLECYLICAWTKRLSKQSGRRWFMTPWRSLWFHCNVCMLCAITLPRTENAWVCAVLNICLVLFPGPPFTNMS